VKIIRNYVETGRVNNVVNLSRQTPAKFVLVVRHKDKPGVLASIFAALRDQAVNVQEAENIVFTGAQAAVARINVDAAPSDDALAAAVASNSDILDIQVVPLAAPASSHHLARTTVNVPQS
jgi:D-3-phosphoglycerate dehydrogenase